MSLSLAHENMQNRSGYHAVLSLHPNYVMGALASFRYLYNAEDPIYQIGKLFDEPFFNERNGKCLTTKIPKPISSLSH